jgi:colanic acid/amylovoran biosynthesis glycosyltransferase
MNRIAYLSNPYPAISHTFIYREIESLRKKGIEIATVSVSQTPDKEKMTIAEQQEAERTLVLKDTSVVSILASCVSLFLHSPAGFLKMTMHALTLCFRGPKNPVKALGYLAEAIILLAWLRKKQITHIHEHFANPTAFVAMLCKRYGGISYSLSIHGPDVFSQVDSTMLADKVKEATFIRCISNYCKSQIMLITPHHLWKQHHIVRCGVDTDIFHARTPPENTVPQILCVGRLCPAKGQHILIEACGKLREQGVSFAMRFVGDGPERTSLEDLSQELGLEEFIHFTGVLGQDEVKKEYEKADFFVLPSFAEGVPVVLMEAMAMTIPVISTRITGIPELIDHGTDGLLATPGDVDDLASQLHLLLEDRAFGERLGAAGRNKVSEKYSQEKNNAELAEIFIQLGDDYVGS